MAGREVMCEGLGWLMGSREDIRVWHDPWLSTDFPISPMGPPIQANHNLCVSDLIYQDTRQ